MDGSVNVTATDIKATNGRYHHVEGVLVPEAARPLLPHRCDVIEASVVHVRGTQTYAHRNTQAHTHRNTPHTPKHTHYTHHTHTTDTHAHAHTHTNTRTAHRNTQTHAQHTSTHTHSPHAHQNRKQDTCLTCTQ